MCVGVYISTHFYLSSHTIKFIWRIFCRLCIFLALDIFFGSFDFWFVFFCVFVSSKEKNVEWQNLAEDIRVYYMRHSIASNLTDKYQRLCVEMCMCACGGIIVLAFARNLMLWQSRERKKNSNIFNRNRMKTIFSLFSVVWQACAMWHVSSHACIRWFWICMQSKSNEMILNITFYHCVCVCLCTTYYAKFSMLNAESDSFCCLCSFFLSMLLICMA